MAAAQVRSAQRAAKQPDFQAYQARFEGELLPLLEAQALLGNCLRVLRAIDDYVMLHEDLASPACPLAAMLKEACPTWADPLASGTEWEVMAELSRVAADVAVDIAAGVKS